MSFDGIKRVALQRITAGSEGARLIGSQLTGVTGNNIQVLLEALLARALPSGGATNQVLKKTSGTDYATSWQAESATTPASETVSGVAEIATQAEADAGTDGATIMTPLKFNSSAQLKARATFADLFSDHVVSGFNPSLPGATLTMTTPAGVAYIGGARVSIAADTSRAYTASRDVYLDVNASGTYTAVAVTNGAAEPAVTASSLRILKVVTSGTQVTAITQRGRATNFPARLAKGAFHAYQSSAQTATAASIVKVNLQSEDYDLDNWFDSTTNYRFIPQLAGFYLFTAAVNTITITTAQHYLLCWLYKNGGSHRAGSASYVATTGIGLSAAGSWIAYANGTTDYFELYYQGSGTALVAASASTFLSGVYLGASANIPGP